MNEIWQLSATELAQRIASRQLSSVEVVDAHLSRIDAVNPALNAVVRVLADEARARRSWLTRNWPLARPLGPYTACPSR
jgi:amidase